MPRTGKPPRMTAGAFAFAVHFKLFYNVGITAGLARHFIWFYS